MAFNWKNKPDDDITKFVTRQHGRMADRRRIQENLRSLIVKIFRPRRYDILGDREPGMQYGAKVYDQQPANALSKFVGGKIGYMVSRQLPWMGFVPTDSRLLRKDNIKQYMQEAAEQILFAAGRSNLYSALVPHALDAHSVATSCMVPMRDSVKDRVVFDVVHPRDSYIGINKYGDPIIYHRTQELTNLTALEMFPRKNLPDSWFVMREGKATNELKNPFQTNKYIWAVYPNDDRDNSSVLATDKQFKVLCTSTGRGKKSRVFLNSGDDVFPICWRSLRESGFEYGTSLSMDCLTAALMVNKLGEKNLTAAHLAVDPRRLASDTLKQTLRTNPGSTTWVSNINQESVKAWEERLNWPITDAQMERIHAQLDDRFFIRFFEMLSSGELSQVKTAYEVSQMMGEKATLMSTIVDTFEQESLEPCIAVLVKEETKAGRMPQIPDELIETGGKVNIRYSGPLHQLQQVLLRGKPIMDALAIIAQMAELDQYVPLKFDFMEMAEEAAITTGLSQRFVKSDEEVRRIIDEANKRQQAAEQAEMAEKAAGAAKNLSGSVAPDSALAAMAQGAAA